MSFHRLPLLVLGLTFFLNVASAETGGPRPLYAEPDTVEPPFAPHFYSPQEYASYYQLPPNIRPHLKIGILGAAVSPCQNQDLANFQSRYGVAPIHVTDIYLGTPVTTCKPTGSISGKSSTRENALDLQAINALAPGADVLVVHMKSLKADDFHDAIQALMAEMEAFVGPNQRGVVSISYGGNANYFAASNFATIQQYDAAVFGNPAYANLTAFVSAGDSTMDDAYPASSPHVVAVGGTSLIWNGPGQTPTEVYWGRRHTDGSLAGGGFGVSNFFPVPNFQIAERGWNYESSPYIAPYRTFPDISMEADPETGLIISDVYDSAPGKSPFTAMGGTSLAAPLMASLWATVEQFKLTGPAQVDETLHSLYYDMPRLWSYHDVTQGADPRVTSVGGCPNLIYCSAPGYDLVTGLGTPSASSMIWTAPAGRFVYIPFWQMQQTHPLCTPENLMQPWSRGPSRTESDIFCTSAAQTIGASLGFPMTKIYNVDTIHQLVAIAMYPGTTTVLPPDSLGAYMGIRQERIPVVKRRLAEYRAQWEAAANAYCLDTYGQAGGLVEQDSGPLLAVSCAKQSSDVYVSTQQMQAVEPDCGSGNILGTGIFPLSCTYGATQLCQSWLPRPDAFVVGIPTQFDGAGFSIACMY